MQNKVAPLPIQTDENFEENDEYILSLLNFVAGHIDELKDLDAFVLKNLDDLSQSLRKKSKTVEMGLQALGWSPVYGWLKYFANFDQLLRELSNLHLSTSKSKKGLHSIISFNSFHSTPSDSQMIAQPHHTMSFCPDTLVCHITMNPILQPGVSMIKGSLMIADISGFTQFSSQMCARGAVGLDSLYNITNNFLGEFVDIIYIHGGDVISFAGDALIAIFPDSINEREFDQPACRNSLVCACRLNLHAQTLLINLDNIALSAHFGVVYGEFSFAVMGGIDGQWTYLLSGPQFSELGGCLDKAGPREVVCSSYCYEIAHKQEMLEKNQPARRLFAEVIEDSAFLKVGWEKQIASISDAATDATEKMAYATSMDIWSSIPTDTALKHWSIAGDNSGNDDHGDNSATHRELHNRENICGKIMTQSLKASLSKFVPRPVLGSADAAALTEMSELRHVTTVFLKLDSFSAQIQRDPLQLEAFFHILQEVLKESNGYLRQFLVDDKGCVAIAFWGVSNFKSTNGASRGLFFAVSMIRRARELGHEVSVGLTSGYVYCGVVGSKMRQDYVCIGDKVNLAARLMGKAKGRVLIDKETSKLLNLEERRSLVLAEELQLKGRVAPLRPFTYASSELPSLLSERDLYGRSTVLRSDLVDLIKRTLNRYQRTPAEDGVSKFSSAHSHHSPENSMYVVRKVHPLPQGLAGQEGQDGSVVATGAAMAARSSKTPVGTTANSFADPMLSQRSGGGIDTIGVSIIALLGPRGSAKSTASQVFKAYAVKRQMRCIHVVMTEEDRVVPYGLIRKMFAEIVGRDTFADDKLRSRFVVALLQRLYPGMQLKQEFAFKSLIAVLGLDGENFGVEKVDETLPSEGTSVVSGIGEDSSSQQKAKKAARRRNPNFSIRQSADETLQALLKVLLAEKTTAVVVENAHLSDVRSWMELLRIADSLLPIAFLMTLRTISLSSAVETQTAQERFEFGVSSVYIPRAGEGSSRSSGIGSSSAPHSGGGVGGGGGSSSSSGAGAGGRDAQKTQVDHSKSVSIQAAVRIKPWTLSRAIYSTSEAKMTESEGFTAVLESPKTIVVEMTPLTKPEIGAMLVDVLGQANVSSQLVDIVFDASTGLPFWCKFIIRYMKENGVEAFMQSVKGQKIDRLRGQKEIASEHIKFLILYRFDKLTPEQQLVAKHASVIGEHFSEPALLAILPDRLRQPTIIAGLLEALVENSIIRCVAEQPVEVFGFQNQLIRKIIYSTIPQSDLQRIHQSIAEFLEAYFSADLRPYYEDLGYHLKTAGQRMKAFMYSVKAADCYIHMKWFRRALSNLTIAKELADGSMEERVILDAVHAGLTLLEEEHFGKPVWLRKRMAEAFQSMGVRSGGRSRSGSSRQEETGELLVRYTALQDYFSEKLANDGAMAHGLAILAASQLMSELS